jgi:hypothetical protein
MIKTMKISLVTFLALTVGSAAIEIKSPSHAVVM